MSLRVLVVDDAPAVAQLHGRFVDAHPQCELVGTAASGPDAVDAIRSLEPDLVLLDVHLPGFSGIEALRAVRADAAVRQPEVVAVTAARDVETVRDARLMGVRHYIVKPFTAHDLHQRIDDVIAVMSAQDAKGLEFDGVVLVEPADLLTGHTRGAGDLYVAMTRSTQRLDIVHARPLPQALASALVTAES